MGDTTNHSSPSPFPKIHYSCTYNINQEPRYFSSQKKKQDIPCPKIIHCYLGLSSEERRQPFSGPLYINTPLRKKSPYKPLRT